MTHRQGVAGGHDVVARWCALAEQRLQYLTEMFESGRWRRYHSEIAFLENVREAKVAVDTWRGLSAPASSDEVSAVALSLSGPTEASPPRSTEPKPEQLPREPLAPEPIEVRAAPAELASSEEGPSGPVIGMIALDRAIDVQGAAFDLSVLEQRYPLLRNSL
jgi:uncharacterized repeat protein (TIGR03809 family)